MATDGMITPIPGATPSIEDILGASSIQLLPQIQGASMVKLYAAKKAGDTEMIVTQDLLGLAAWLIGAMAEAPLGRYEVGITYMPDNELVKLAEVTKGIYRRAKS